MVNKRLYCAFFLLFILVMNSGVIAQQEEKPVRPVTTTTFLTLGRNQAYDSYLSISSYKGIDAGLGFERFRVASFGESRWVMRHLLEFDVASTRNKPRNGKMLTGMIDYSFGLYRSYSLPFGLKLFGGGDLEANVGGIYNMRNSNNPAVGKVSFNLGLAGMAVYTLKIKNYPLTFRYQMSLPFAGTFFGPGFGETYYGIFGLGNTKGTVHFGSFHNQFDMTNLLSVDLPVGKNALHLGYKNRLRSTRQNHLEYKLFTHAFSIGITTEFITRSQRKKAESKNRPVWSVFY